jgi:hypothetical protein
MDANGDDEVINPHDCPGIELQQKQVYTFENRFNDGWGMSKGAIVTGLSWASRENHIAVESALIKSYWPPCARTW